MTHLGLQSNNDTYLMRCPQCGDSKNPNHGHLYVSLSRGVFYCMRCQYKGKVDLTFLNKNKINAELHTESDFEDFIVHTLPFGVSGRPTTIPTVSVKIDEIFWDMVYIYNQYGQKLGYHLRTSKPEKRSKTKTWGYKGIAYPYAPQPLTSSIDNPIKLVEGIYDCVGKNDVAVFGMIQPQHIEMVKHQYVIIRPDGDVWVRPDLKKEMLKTIRKFLIDTDLVFLGVEIITDGLDIDEVTDYTNQVHFVPRHELEKRLLCDIKTSL